MAEYRINMTPGYSPEQLSISQNDIGRVVSIYLIGANKEAYIIPTGATVQLLGTKPSGLGFTVTGTYTDATADFTVTAEMSDEAGHIPCEVRVISSGAVIGSSNADLYVEDNPHPDGTTDGTAEHVVSIITALVERAETAVDEAEDAAQEAREAVSEIVEMTATATTLPAGTSATASYNNGLLTIGVPQGVQGERGIQGIQGIQGEKGETGPQGPAYVLTTADKTEITNAVLAQFEDAETTGM